MGPSTQPHRPADGGRDLPRVGGGAAAGGRGADRPPGHGDADAAPTARARSTRSSQNTNVTDARLGDADRATTRSRPTDVTGLHPLRRVRLRDRVVLHRHVLADADRARAALLSTSRTARRRAGSRSAARRSPTRPTQAFTGTHSLKTTNRTASFMGPGVSLHGPADQGRDLSGDAVGAPGRRASRRPRCSPPCQRTPTGGSAAFDTVAHDANVTDAGLGDHDRALLVHHRQLGLHLLRPDDVGERVVLHRQRQHRAGRAAARPARQHRGRQQHVRERHDRGLEVAHGRRDGRRHARADAHGGTLQPADHATAPPRSRARPSTSPT